MSEPVSIDDRMGGAEARLDNIEGMILADEHRRARQSRDASVFAFGALYGILIFWLVRR